MTRRTKRDYCTGCRRWIYTWQETRWGGSWEGKAPRPIFGKFCAHGKWCRDCWADHSRTAHAA